MAGHTKWADIKHKAARHWTVELETRGAAFGEDELERFAVAIERDFGAYGPSAALHSGELAITLSPGGSNAEAAFRRAREVLDSGLAAIDKDPRAVTLERVTVEPEELTATS